MKKLLIIDDDRFFCESVSRFFDDRNMEVLTVHDRSAARALFAENQIDVILLDQKLPDGPGVDLCAPILAANDQAKIIFITAYPSFDNAINAIRSGATDYLLKPVEVEELGMAVDRAFRMAELERVEQIQDFKNQKDHLETVLVGQEGGLREISRLIDLSAGNEATVLITGETGTGKNVVAKTIHYRMPKKGTGFVDINCAALPENLIESELFGHEKGAFTGAVSLKKGIFEMAHGGTLFLDEIGEIPLPIQSKLLGVLDEKKLKRVGGQSFQRIDVRIIAATNLALEKAVQNKTFREDLYYRLSVLRIHLPPLRERKEDIPVLCRYLIRKMAGNDEVAISEGEIRKLCNYHWPGNVRELKNIIERSIILKRGHEILPSLLIADAKPVHCPRPMPFSLENDTFKTLAEIQENHILKVLERMDYNHTRAAKVLGVSRSTLLRKLKKISGR